MREPLYIKNQIPSSTAADIFNITKSYKDDPSKGLSLINQLLKRRYPCFENEESFIYNSYPYPCVYFVNSIEQRKYAYKYYIRIYRDNKNEGPVGDLTVIRDWDWDEPAITKRTYEGVRGEPREINAWLFYLQEDEDEEFIKRIMENLIMEDLKKEHINVTREPNNIRKIVMKNSLKEN